MIPSFAMLSATGNFREWWDVASATVIAAYQPKGAVSSASAKMDLTGNGYHLTGADPTWSSATGWTSFAGFDAISGLTLPYTISVVWAGAPAFAASGDISMMSNSALNWTGIVMHGTADPGLWCSYNAAIGNRIGAAVSGSGAVFVYTKNESTNAQEVFEDASSVSDDTNGSTPTTRSATVYTGDYCWAVALYDGILSSGDITTISNTINAL